MAGSPAGLCCGEEVLRLTASPALSLVIVIYLNGIYLTIRQQPRPSQHKKGASVTSGVM